MGPRPQQWGPGLAERRDEGGTADLDLGGVRLTDLDVRADASVVEVNLPADAGQLTLAVLSKAAAVTIRVPDGVAAWLRGEMDTPVLELDISRFQIEVLGREYRSADYEAARNRVDLPPCPMPARSTSSRSLYSWQRVRQA